MMLLSVASGLNSVAQFITMLIIFVFVLGVTYFVTRYVAGVQKDRYRSGNMEIIETLRISNSKYLQIVRIGNKYFGMAVCKDTVTMLGEIQKENLFFNDDSEVNCMNFREILEKIKSSKLDNNKQDTNEENRR